MSGVKTTQRFARLHRSVCLSMPSQAWSALDSSSHRSAMQGRLSRRSVSCQSTSDNGSMDLVKSSTKARTFQVTDSSQLPALIAASVPLLLRLGSGALTAGYSASIGKENVSESDPYRVLKVNGYSLIEKTKVVDYSRPEEPIILYDSEGCPFCRKVRECVSILDLDVIFLPTPRGGARFRLDSHSYKKQVASTESCLQIMCF